MAIGVISSPASWLVGTVASPTWFQDAQDSINFAVGTNYLWASVGDMYVDGGATGFTMGSQGLYWAASAASQALIVPIRLPYYTSGTYATGKRYKPTQFDMRCLAGGAGALNIGEFFARNMSNTSAPATFTGTAATTSGSGQQTVTLTPTGTLWQNDDQIYYLRIVSANNGDRVYGVKITYGVQG